MIRKTPESYCVLITEPDGRKRVFQADLSRDEAEGIAIGINLIGTTAGQRADVMGYFPVQKTKRFAKA